MEKYNMCYSLSFLMLTPRRNKSFLECFFVFFFEIELFSKIKLPSIFTSLKYSVSNF